MTEEQVETLIALAIEHNPRTKRPVVEWRKWCQANHIPYSDGLTWASINTFTKREAKQRRLSKASIETYIHLIRIRMVYEGVERGWLPESAIAESYNKKAKRPNSSSFSKVLERAAKVRQSNKEKASRPTSINSLLKITSGPEAARLLGIPFSEFSEYVSGKRMPSDDLRDKARELVTKGLSRRLPEALLYPHGNEKVSRWTINSM